MRNIFLFFLILLLVIYLLQIVFRYLVPWLLKKYIEKHMPKDDDQNENINNEPSKKDKIIPDDKGEYIDYEEVDEKNHKLDDRGS